MVTHPDPADEQLALRTSQGDRDAFAELYSRHFPGVYDLVFRMVRDQDVAADTAQNAFIRAWESLQKRTVSGNVRAWLFTIARNTALNEIRRQKRWREILDRQPEGEQSAAFEAVDTSRLSNPEAVVGDQELVDLVWTSAAALGPRDYSLLDLHLRRDLSAGEMATDLGLSSASVHVMLSRLKDTLEESVAVALMVRRGRRDCPELSEIVSQPSGAELSRNVRLEVRHHLKECELCAESRKRFVAPAEIFSSLAMVPVSSEMTAGIWSKISPMLTPGAGSLPVLGVLALVRDRVSHWWAGAGTGTKAAGFVVLGGVVAVPAGVALLVAASAGGSDDPVSAADSLTGLLAAPSQTEPPQSSSPQRGSPAASPTPPVAAIVASPLPSNQADVIVVRVDLTVNSQPSAGQPFLLSAAALLRNPGGATSALVDTTFVLSAPAGCVFAPAAPPTVQDKNLPLGPDVSITRTWSVTCSAAGEHSLGVAVSASIDPSQALIDPNPANNANSGTVPVSVLP